MCIFAGEVESVKSTRIFVCPNRDYTRQITVYKNKVNTTDTHNAMILPVPFVDSIRLHEGITKWNEKVKGFFDVCSDCFSVRNGGRRSRGFSSEFVPHAAGNIAVLDYGNFNVSIVRNVDDMTRLDSLFGVNVSPTTMEVLRRYYSKGWGFLVCKLKPEETEYHPIAYSHQIHGNAMFVPTRHQHGGDEPESYSVYDHIIYVVNGNSYPTLKRNPEQDRNTLPSGGLSRFWRWDRIFIDTDNIPDFDWTEPDTFLKYHVYGELENRDFIHTLVA